MITGLIFSRDRAMQLDATLRSFLSHCRDNSLFDLIVLYKTSNDVHADQYASLIIDYCNYRRIKFYKQTNFRFDVLKILIGDSRAGWRYLIYSYLWKFVYHFRSIHSLWIEHNNPCYFLFMVDDNLFVRDFSLEHVIQTLEDHPEALGFSLRLGKNSTFCYPASHDQNLPDFLNIAPGILEFMWTNGEYDFNYPLEVSSSIYRAKDLLPLLNNLKFTTPNQMEGGLAQNKEEFLDKPYMLCFEESVTFCAPVNKVQNDYENRSGKDLHLSIEELARRFYCGERIDVSVYNGFTPSSCHQEVEFKFLDNKRKN